MFFFVSERGQFSRGQFPKSLRRGDNFWRKGQFFRDCFLYILVRHGVFRMALTLLYSLTAVCDSLSRTNSIFLLKTKSLSVVLPCKVTSNWHALFPWTQNSAAGEHFGFSTSVSQKIALRDDFCRSHHLSMILCTIKAKILHVGVACGDGTIFEGTITQIFAEKGQFVKIVPSGGDKKHYARMV